MQLICAFVFAYAKSRFSHDAAPITTGDLIDNKMKKDRIFKTHIFKTDFDTPLKYTLRGKLKPINLQIDLYNKNMIWLTRGKNMKIAFLLT